MVLAYLSPCTFLLLVVISYSILYRTCHNSRPYIFLKTNVLFYPKSELVQKSLFRIWILHFNRTKSRNAFIPPLSSTCGCRTIWPVALWIKPPTSVADPNPGSGMGKKSGSGSWMNNPDHISESLETISWVKIPVLKFFDADPAWEKFGSLMENLRILDPGWKKIWIRDKHPGSATLPPTLDCCLYISVPEAGYYLGLPFFSGWYRWCRGRSAERRLYSYWLWGELPGGQTGLQPGLRHGLAHQGSTAPRRPSCSQPGQKLIGTFLHF